MESQADQQVVFANPIKDQTLSREDIIKQYLEKDVPDGKSTFCRFYRRGCCLFTAKECKHAHGARDLQFKRIDLEEYEKNCKAAAENSEATNEKPKKEEDNEEENYVDKDRDKQPSIMLEMNYKDVYEYQFILKERGEVEKIYSQSDINLDRPLRKSIRDMLMRDLQQEFVDFLYKEYNTDALKKAFIEKCFNSCAWHPHWKFLLNKTYGYEVKSAQRGMLFVKQPQGEAFDEYMENLLVRIIKENNLLEQLPISPSTVTKLYYQFLGPLEPLLPPHHVFLKRKDLKSIDDYLESVQNTDRFRSKLANACSKSIEEVTEMVIFAHSSQELQALMKQIKTILLKMIEKSHIGLILYSRYEAQVMEECKDKLQKFNSNLPQIKKLMVKIALDERVLLINLGSETYLFSLDKFNKANVKEIGDKYNAKLFSGCTLSPSDHFALVDPFEISEDKLKVPVPDRLSEEDLEKELDINKIVLIDNLETLDMAIAHFANVEAIGVDIEGSLRKNGRLELIQCGSRDKIFVFDIYKTKKQAEAGDKSTYQKMAEYLKNLMEDSKICKIFHDGRKDSLALHVFLDACPSNVFDLSAVYMLIEFLERYKSQIEKFNLKKSSIKQEEEEKKDIMKEVLKSKGNQKTGEIFTFSDDISLPGLNEVLERYEASHGLNKLKHIMKSRFGRLPLDYFLNRPIDKEYLIYSAKDVEDLVEVKEKMKIKLKEMMSFFLKDLESEKIDLLCQEVSKTYALHGCQHSK